LAGERLAVRRGLSGAVNRAVAVDSAGGAARAVFVGDCG
jgi:hypothetical protein